MWKISWRKRWCYSVATKRVGSVYAPKPGVSVHSYFDVAWKYRGVTDQDSYYTNLGIISYWDGSKKLILP